MSIQPILIAAAALFSIGIYGILVRRNAVMVLLSIELILNSVNINFVAFNAMLSEVFFNIYYHNRCSRSWYWISNCINAV